jgi:hypothetical protein
MYSFDYITITNSTIGTTIFNSIVIPDSFRLSLLLQSFSNQLITYKSLKQNSFYQDLQNMIKQALF